MTEIAGSRALITGGASGIGLGLARELAGRGAEVVLWDIDGDALDAAVASIRDAGGRAEGQVCDVSRRETVYDVARQLRERFGPVDVLVNNAGIVTGKSLLESPDSMIEKTMAVNAMANFWTVKAFLPEMLERDRGHIVTIGSAAGLMGVNGLVDYCASKHAAVGFDDALRNELRQRGSAVRTTVVCPYFVDTHMFAGAKTRYAFLLPFLRQDEVVKRIAKAVDNDHTRLIMPPLVRLQFLLRLFPSSWFDRVMDGLGVHHAMDDFGHGKPADATVAPDASAEARQPADGDPGGPRGSASRTS
ncbi:MAG: SDR family oxidoreductase [Myxococcota bacterium]